jgi:energy-coupling factor transporter ATP-binding protein EcfA2
LSQYENLSPYDFESLCRDLFAAKENVHFETFTVGRDGGIDIRYIGNGRKSNPDVVIQCKHYERSGFSALKSKMLAEKKKALGLRAKKYILATTVSMTPENKTTLFTELHPLIKSEGDIYAKDEVDALLRDYPEVEKSHFRLWLNSTAVLERVLHNSIFAQTDVYLEELEQTASTFVDNSGVADVQEMLEKTHVCIITGPAGVGKTTLANMMLIYYMGQGFQPVVVSENFSEAQHLYSKENKQIFLYDDFLGRTTGLDNLGKNEDDRIANFIRAISRAPSKRLLMTTRQQILEQATLKHEPLGRAHVKQTEYFFKMKAYSRSNKAHILYNHLYFSDLTQEHKQEIVISKLYPVMVGSKNFTPRAVESAIAFALKNTVPPEDIAQFLVDSIEDPRELWRGQLTTQISHAQRVILAFLVLERGITRKEHLERFYLSAEGSLQEQQSFDSAMRGLEGSAIELRDLGGIDMVAFANPGVEDAVLDHVLPMKNVLRLLIGSSGYARSIVLWNHANDEVEYKQRRSSRYSSPTHLTPRSTAPSRPSLQIVVDSLMAEFLVQLVQGVEASWDKTSARESQLSNLLIMNTVAVPAVSGPISFDKLVTKLCQSWAQGQGAKDPAFALLSLVLDNEALLDDKDRRRLIDAAAAFIADASNDATDDFYAMFALVGLFDSQSLAEFDIQTQPLELHTVQELAEEAAIAEWEGISGRGNLHELREEVDGWRNLLDELGVDEPDSYYTASAAVEEAEQEAEGYEESWSRDSISSEQDDTDIHVMFSSLTDNEFVPG